MKENNKSQAQPKRNENPSSVIENFIRQFRNDDVSALVHLDKDEQTQVVNWAQDVVNQLGSVLKEKPMKIKNLVELPCPKEDFKIAIKVLLSAYITKGSDDTVKLLKDRYVSLGAFQEISQEDKESVITKIDEIDQKAESADTALLRTFQKYMELIISEQSVLLDDINTFINDLDLTDS